MELWQLAALLEADLDHPDDVPLDLLEKEKHTLAERAQRIRDMKEPEPEETDITRSIMKQMGIRTEA